MVKLRMIGSRSWAWRGCWSEVVGEAAGATAALGSTTAAAAGMTILKIACSNHTQADATHNQLWEHVEPRVRPQNRISDTFPGYIMQPQQ